MEDETSLRQQLVKLLDWQDAHVDFRKAIRSWPAKLRGTQVVGVPYTAWQLLEHMRIAQWDILEFSRDPKHVSPEWPQGYWPEKAAPSSQAAWDRSIKAFRSDLKAVQQLVADPKTDLGAPIPHGQGQTIFREAVLVADHNAYHLGQLVMLRRLLGAWE